MKTLAVLLALSVGSVHAQITTLTYDGVDTTGSYTSLATGAYSVAGPFTFDATFDATLVISGSLANTNDLRLVSASVSAGSFGPLDFGPGGMTGGPYFCNMFGCINLSFKDGLITGATADFTDNLYHSSNEKFSLGPTGDSLLYQYASTFGTCDSLTHGGHQPNNGPPIKFCDAHASNTTAGEWTVTTVKAPEIDPASAAGGLTLLFGALAVLLSRRKNATVGAQD